MISWINVVGLEPSGGSANPLIEAAGREPSGGSANRCHRSPSAAWRIANFAFRFVARPDRAACAAPLLLALIWPSAASAQIAAERVFPPAVKIGEASPLKIDGKFPAWSSTHVDCDRQEIEIQLGEQSGELQVTVPPGAAPGVAWIRVYDPQSASKLMPLILFSDELHNETEPNDSLGGTPYNLPCGLMGRLEKRGDVDGFLIQAKAGRPLIASLTAHQILGSPMDGVLQVVDLAGNVLAQSEDQRGLDPQVVFTPDVDQQLIVRLFAFPEVPDSTIGFSGASSYVYLLMLTDQLYVDHALPLVIDARSDERSAIPARGFACSGTCIQPQQLPGTQVSPATLVWPQFGQWQWLVPSNVANSDGASYGYYFDDAEIDVGESQKQMAKLPAVFSGHILQPGETDKFMFSTERLAVDGKQERPQKIRAEVMSQKLGYTLDSVIRIVDAESGQELAKGDDISRNDYDTAVEFDIGTSTAAELQISDLADSGSLRHAYSVVVSEVQPSFSLSVAAEQFLVKQGAETEIELSIARLHGFDQPLEVTAVDLPQGVSCSAVLSQPKGDSSKTVKLKLVAAKDSPPFQGVFRIQATELKTQRSAIASFPLRPQVPLKNLWLSVVADSLAK